MACLETKTLSQIEKYQIIIVLLYLCVRAIRSFPMLPHPSTDSIPPSPLSTLHDLFPYGNYYTPYTNGNFKILQVLSVS